MKIFNLLNEALDGGEAVVLCTIVNTKGSTPRQAGAKMLVYSDGRFEGTIGGGEVENRVHTEAMTSFKDGKTRFLTYDLVDPEKGDAGLCGGVVTVFIEPFLELPTVVVVGAGHVGQPIVHLAKWLGFRVVLSDDRVELCTPERTPGADLYLPIPMHQIPEQLSLNNRTYLVLVTRGSEVDVEGLPALLETDVPYIGLIGSKRRWAHTQEKLIEKGVTSEALARIKSPIGLFIHAETPNEIAISVLAEIIAHYNQMKKHFQRAEFGD
ncbi:MAG: XdhC family protein [Chloroflexi bacterium]|jgi:xanthine dehydrogenase accessory factor|nr:XdhC family protein [Chloroflexota bacterium]